LLSMPPYPEGSQLPLFPRFTRRGCLVSTLMFTGAAGALGIAIVVALRVFFPSPGDRLPWTATEIREYRHSDQSFLPDYTYCLEARITRREFETWAAGLHLQVGPPASTQGPLECPFSYADRTTPWVSTGTPELIATGTDRDPRTTETAIYADGWLHFVVVRE
jgi:hypothetical protein